MRTLMGKAFWAQHVEAANQSGLSATAYAKQQGISAKRLLFWRNKLKQTASTDTPHPAGAFVAVRVAAPTSASCTLILATGLRLEMLGLPAPEWLVAVGRSLQGAR